MRRIDAHVYVGEALFDRPHSAEDILNGMDRNQIDFSLLIANKPPQYDLCLANKMVSQLVKLHPEKFGGLARIDPWQRKLAIDELTRCHEEYGFMGLLLNPWEELFQISHPIVYPLIEYARQKCMFVMVECGYAMLSHPFDVAELAHTFPDVTFIGTHGLQLDGAAHAMTDAELVMHECPNLIMETSGAYAPALVERMVNDLGAQRVLFGSQSPWFSVDFEIERINRLNISAEDRDAVFGGNMLALLR